MGFDYRKADAWRAHPLLTKTMRHSVPGLGVGLAAFAVYVAYDHLTKQSGGKADHH